MSYTVLTAASRDAWLLQRKQFITASDIPALLGESRWRDRASVIAEKLGHGVPFEGNLKTYWGRISEASILQGFAELCNIRVVPNSSLFCNPDVVGLAATPDAMADCGLRTEVVRDLPPIEVDKVFHSTYNTLQKAQLRGWDAVVDAKCVASRNRSKWKTEQPPQEYFGQIQAQMLVTGTRVGFLVAKVDAHELYAYAIEADEFYQDLIRSEVLRAIDEIRELRRKDQNGTL